jgi:hypothetical protein
MSVPAKLCAFLLALGGVFAGAYGAGTLTGPVGASDAAGHPMATGNTAAGHDTLGGHRTEEASSSGPGGLAASADGYTLRPLGGHPRPGTPGEVDAHAAPVTRFRTNHDKQLHLIVVRLDLTGFRHVQRRCRPTGPGAHR